MIILFTITLIGGWWVLGKIVGDWKHGDKVAYAWLAITLIGYGILTK